MQENKQNPPDFVSDVLVAVGSNIKFEDEDPADIITSALAWLSYNNCPIRQKSKFYRTPAFPAGSGPDFVNAAIAVAWAGPPQALMKILHECEAAFGRARDTRWGARTQS